MELKPLSSKPEPEPAVKREAQGRKEIQVPRVSAARVRRGDEPDSNVAIMIFGVTGTGKTYSIVPLLLGGAKVLVLSTDIGSSGLLSVKIALRKQKPEALKNLVEIQLHSYQAVIDFLSNPESVFPEIYDFDPDWIVWDTFSSFQQIELSEMVGEMTPVGKDPSAGRLAGLSFEQADWGMIRNSTVRVLDKFLSLNNKKSGKSWYKLVTAHEALRQVPGVSGEFREAREPMIQGAAGKLVAGAFDLIIRTHTKSGGEDGNPAFFYQVSPTDLRATKNRGIVFPDENGKPQTVFPADFGYVWRHFSSQAGYDPRLK